MTTFLAYASDFQVYPDRGEAFDYLSRLLGGLRRVEFTLRVDDPSVNQGQMTSDFDKAMERAILADGAKPFDLKLPSHVPQEYDFAFTYSGRTVAVEIEKTNREKILRDMLKCHMYLQSGADFAIIGLPKNYPHAHGVWNLFEFGTDRFRECNTYGFGTPDKLGRILLLGFTQYAAISSQPLSRTTREMIRRKADAGEAGP